jgi:putative phage-type endonuclease
MPTLYDEPEETTLAAVGVTCKHNTGAIVAHCEQGTPQWFGLRCGVISASNAEKIVTKHGEPTTGQKRLTYMHQLIAEKITGIVEDNAGGKQCEYGKEQEPRARAYYRMKTGRQVEQVGFVYRDGNRDVGCSPDGICEDRLIEIKCPYSKSVFVGLLLKHAAGKFPMDYWTQMQQQMYVTGIEKNELVVYGDWTGLPQMVTWELVEDAGKHALYAQAFAEFNMQVAEGVAAIQEAL